MVIVKYVANRTRKKLTTRHKIKNVGRYAANIYTTLEHIVEWREGTTTWWITSNILTDSLGLANQHIVDYLCEITVPTHRGAD